MKLKQDLPNQSELSDKLPRVLEEMRNEHHGLKVPDGYFDSLSPRIADRLANGNRSYLNSFTSALRKPSVWSPVLATALVAITLFFVIPGKNGTDSIGYDTLTELNNGYDASFADEVMLAESSTIDSELTVIALNDIEPLELTGVDLITDEEIAEYLKDQEIESELLTDK